MTLLDLTLPVLALSMLAACGPTTSDSDPTDGSTTVASSEPLTEPDTTPTTTGEPETSTAADTGTDPTATATASATATTVTSTTTDDTTTDGFVCGDELPPEGSACAEEDAECNPNADECDPFVFAICQAGTWSYIEVGPGECEESCDPFPTEGDACKVEGASCNTGCTDQCSFCNIVSCTDGMWKHVEVFPAPCLGCEEICQFTVEPMCAAGPPTQQDCVAGCMDIKAGECNDRYSDVLACAGTMPTFTCDAMQRPLVDTCADQFDALYTCLGI